ncbi:Os04g0556100, partial [Oryza sativa Japonica Group]
PGGRAPAARPLPAPSPARSAGRTAAPHAVADLLGREGIERSVGK